MILNYFNQTTGLLYLDETDSGEDALNTAYKSSSDAGQFWGDTNGYICFFRKSVSFTF